MRSIAASGLLLTGCGIPNVNTGSRRRPGGSAGLAFGNDVQFAGAKAEPGFDSEGACGGGGLDAATVLPGKAYTYEQAYAVAREKGELQIALQPDFASDKAEFVGHA